jgi:hypothetical protein
LSLAGARPALDASGCVERGPQVPSRRLKRRSPTWLPVLLVARDPPAGQVGRSELRPGSYMGLLPLKRGWCYASTTKSSGGLNFVNFEGWLGLLFGVMRPRTSFSRVGLWPLKQSMI